MPVVGKQIGKRGPDSARLEGRRARARLSNEHFAAFLQAIKELNSGRQTREDTLAAAHDIFGPANPDLYASFDGALARRHAPGVQTPPSKVHAASRVSRSTIS